MEPNKKMPKTIQYDWRLHEMALIWLSSNRETKTDSPLSAVFFPGINSQGVMRIYCNQSCCKRKIEQGFLCERPDYKNLSQHAYAYHRAELKAYPCKNGRTHVDAIEENSEALRFCLEIRDKPQVPILVNSTGVIQDVKYKIKRTYEQQIEDADNYEGGVKVGQNLALQAGKGVIRKRKLFLEDNEQTTSIGAFEHFFLKEPCDITIPYPSMDIKRSISNSEILILYIQDRQLYVMPAVNETTAVHYWTLLEPEQKKLFQDVKFFRIWLPQSGKYFCVHPKWTILKENAPVKKS